MLVTEVKGNVSDKEFVNMPKDYVVINWYEAFKKIQRLVSKEGREIGIKQSDKMLASGLRDGDVLAVEDGTAIVVEIEAVDCIFVKYDNVIKAVRITYEIGNRHSPIFFGDTDEELILPYDKPILAVLQKLGADPGVKKAKLRSERAISSPSNTGGGHSHDDDYVHPVPKNYRFEDLDDHGHNHSHIHSHNHNH